MFIRIPDLWRYLGCKKKYKDLASTPRNTHLRVIDLIDGTVCQRPRHSPVQFCSQGRGDNLRGFRGRQDLPREVFTLAVRAAAHAHSVTICQKIGASDQKRGDSSRLGGSYIRILYQPEERNRFPIITINPRVSKD